MNVTPRTKKTIAASVALSSLAVAAASLLTVAPDSLAQSSSGGGAKEITPKRFSQFFVDATSKVRPAVVSLQVVKTVQQSVVDPFESMFGSRRPRTQSFQQQGYGSGVIVSKDGYILTNNHVAGGADVIVAKLFDGRRLEGKLVGADPLTDLAVVKVVGDDLPVATIGTSANLQVGEWVVAIGSPFQLDSTVTAGIVSATGRANVGVAQYEDFIQTDAAINPGNSGGPLINLDGEIVGINSAILGGMQRSNLGIGFAIPVDMAKFVMRQIVENGHVVRGYLGIDPENISADLAEQFSVKEGTGVLVARVGPETPAATAGLKRNDVIVGFNGKSVNDADKFRLLVAETAPGSRVPIDFLRGGEKRQASVEIVPRPALAAAGDDPDGPAAAPNDRRGAPRSALSRLGFEAEDLDRGIARELGIQEEDGGALITYVAPGSVAANAGLQRGDVVVAVGQQPIDGADRLEETLARYRSGSKAAFLIARGAVSKYVMLRMP